MTDEELQQARREKWRVDGRPARTLEEARAFIESTGTCLLYPVKGVLAPTFIGAYVGSDEHLPTWQHAYADPRCREATELMVRLLREKTAFEATPFGESNFLVSVAVFPFLYGLVGDKNPRQMVEPGKRSEYSPLARDVFEVIREQGRISKPRLRERLGGDPSAAALDRALRELWSRLRITRVDYSQEEGAFWDALYRWAPQPVQRGLHLSTPTALSALISKYLDTVVAAEQGEVEEFFSHLVPRSRVREALKALLAARELSFVTVGKKNMVHMKPRRQEVEVRPRVKA